MDEPIIDGMSEEERQLLLDLLRCVSEQNEEHRVVSRNSGNSRRPTAISLELDGVNPTSFSQPRLVTWNPLQSWERRGFLHPDLRTSDIAYQFRESAISWYRRTRRLSDADVRRLLGQFLYQQYLTSDEPGEFDPEAVATELGIDSNRLKAQLKVLISIELVSATEGWNFGSTNPGSGQFEWALPSRSYVSLAEPRGIEWAVKGFSDLLLSDTPVVNIDVTVTLQQYIHQANNLPISQENKDRFELLLRRVEEEAEKENPSYKPVQDTLDMLTKVKELAPIGLRFLADQMDTIQRMTRHLPGI